MTHYINPHVTDWQRQIIYGTILAGSSLRMPKLGKNYYLIMSNRNERWMQYKASELAQFASPHPLKVIPGKKSCSFQWRSVSYPFFAEIAQMFYRDGKRVMNRDVLSLLKDSGIAVWFVEAGGVTVAGNYYLSTVKYGKAGTKIISDYFKEMGFSNYILKKNRLLKVAIDSTDAFASLISPRLPKFMLHHLQTGNTCKKIN